MMSEKERNPKEGGGDGTKDLEGWHTVTRKKQQSFNHQGRMDVACRNWNGRNEGTCSFFFSRIPDSNGAKDMLKAFSYYGDVVEVVIPFKRNRRGLRFDFARFRNVKDPRLFAIKLDNIIIGAKKIYVNVPRFQRVIQEAGGGKHHLERKEAEGRVRKVWKAVEIPRNEGRKEEKENVVSNVKGATIDPKRNSAWGGRGNV